MATSSGKRSTAREQLEPVVGRRKQVESYWKGWQAALDPEYKEPAQAEEMPSERSGKSSVHSTPRSDSLSAKEEQQASPASIAHDLEIKMEGDDDEAMPTERYGKS